MNVYVDAGDGMARLGEVAVWSFDVAVWGECCQAASEEEALARFAQRTGVADLEVLERITGPSQVFERDLLPSSDSEVERTLAILAERRAVTIRMVDDLDAASLNRRDPAIVQPTWTTWRSAADIAWHIVDTESRGYPRRAGLPERAPAGELMTELEESAVYIRTLVQTMRRDIVSDYRGEIWTSTKLLRRLAWHEQIEHVFLRRRLRANGIATNDRL